MKQILEWAWVQGIVQSERQLKQFSEIYLTYLEARYSRVPRARRSDCIDLINADLLPTYRILSYGGRSPKELPKTRKDRLLHSTGVQSFSHFLRTSFQNI